MDVFSFFVYIGPSCRLVFFKKFYIHSIKSMLIRDDLALWYIWVLHVFVLSKMHFECWRKSIVLISWSQALWCYLLSQHNSLNFEGWHFRWAWSTISLARCSFYANPNFAQPLPAPRKYQKVLFKGWSITRETQCTDSIPICRSSTTVGH